MRVEIRGKHMTLAELKTKADPVLVSFWTILKTKQDAYFAKHGKYFQLLVSPTNTVSDGADSVFTVRKVSDDSFAADVDVPFLSTIPFQISVIDWTRYSDRGYFAEVTAVVAGTTYKRIRHNNGDDTGWYKYSPIMHP